MRRCVAQISFVIGMMVSANAALSQPESHSNFVYTTTPPTIEEYDDGVLSNYAWTDTPASIEDYGYGVYQLFWPRSGHSPAVVYVCWEELPAAQETERGWVKDAVENSWPKFAALEFRGWTKFAVVNDGIRITVKDEGPHTTKLGKALNGKRNGMVLNFTFQNWNSGCKSKENCIRAIAIHEFGHAIGFAHEQTRPDTPGECSRTQKPEPSVGAKPLTPYDPSSVMNYCDNMYADGGNLSKCDKISVQNAYPKVPGTKTVVAECGN